jgi:TRAP-type mannitol/chloroaromatic compound transport system permease small subunit
MKLKLTLDRSIQVIIAVLMGVMVLNVTWQVFSRYVLGDPSSFTDELARYSMIWLGLLGAAYVSGKQGHLAIDVLVEKIQGKKLFYLQLFIHGMVIFFMSKCNSTTCNKSRVPVSAQIALRPNQQKLHFQTPAKSNGIRHSSSRGCCNC